MTHAERQARYRANHAQSAPKSRSRNPVDRRSRPQRWRDAVAELLALQAGYEVWLDALPESLADSATADALCIMCDSICRHWQAWSRREASGGTENVARRTVCPQ